MGRSRHEDHSRGRRHKGKKRRKIPVIWIVCLVVIAIVAALRITPVENAIQDVVRIRWGRMYQDVRNVTKEHVEENKNVEVKLTKTEERKERLERRREERSEWFKERHERKRMKEYKKKDEMKEQVRIEKKNEGMKKHLGIPKGARLHGKIAAFDGCQSKDKDNDMVKDGESGGMDFKRISYTLYKMIVVFGISSLGDSPAGQHSGWIECFAQRLSYERPFLKYIGIDENDEGIEKAKKVLDGVIDGRYEKGGLFNESNRNEIELLFHWPRLDRSDRDARDVKKYAKHIKKVMCMAKKRGIRYLMIPQFPLVKDVKVNYRKGRWRLEGRSKKPFLLNHLVRGVVPVENGNKNWRLYLTLYSLAVITDEMIEKIDEAM